MADEKTINLENAYIVCLFLEDENDEETVGLIVNKWLLSDTTCLYPCHTSQYKINKAIINKDAPQSDWKFWRIRVISAHGKYQTTCLCMYVHIHIYIYIY